MPQFNIFTFLFQIINVLAVAAILNKILYKPVGKIIADRENQIETSLAQAEQARKEAEELLEKYQRLTANAREEAENIIKQATAQGESLKAEIIAKAQEEAARSLEQAKMDIRREKEKALAEIRNEVAEIALLAASKVIGRTLTSEDHQRIARECVDEVGKMAN